ncbi:MAG: hypothetical protein GY928_26365 [Colwellia sp.]|nr:hypothetical protein [Colwellia sp.]
MTYNGVTIISSQCLELKSLKHSETCILNGNGYSQFVIRDKEFQKSTTKLINIGMSYQINTQLEFSLSDHTQLNTPDGGKKKQLVRVQIRYRY